MLQDRAASKMLIIAVSLQFMISTGMFIACSFALESAYGKELEGDGVLVFLLTFALFFISIAAFILGMWKASIYVCKDCGEIVRPRFWNWFLGIHFFGSRKLFCPKCNKQCWCKHILWADSIPDK